MKIELLFKLDNTATRVADVSIDVLNRQRVMQLANDYNIKLEYVYKSLNHFFKEPSCILKWLS
jgi:hypothetical protein